MNSNRNGEMTMAERLWSDERIEHEVRRIGDNMRLYIDDACTVAEQVRDDLQAALDAANQRIAELEAQGEWEPVIYSTFIEDASHDETYLLATLGGTQLEIGTDPTSGGVTVNLPKEYRLCRRKEGR